MGRPVQIWRVSAAGQVSSVLLACAFIFLAAAPLWAPDHPGSRQQSVGSAPPASPTPSWVISISGPAGSTVLPLSTAQQHGPSAVTIPRTGASSGPLPGWAAFLWATACLLVAGLCVRSAFSLRVTLTATEVVIKNMFRSHRLSLAEISSVASGYYGTVFTLRDGTRVTAWAVQKSNLARWTETKTRADQLIDAIGDAAHGE